MGANKIDVAYVADLARLELTDEEKALFQPQLENIVSYVEKISGVDVEVTLTRYLRVLRFTTVLTRVRSLVTLRLQSLLVAGSTLVVASVLAMAVQRIIASLLGARLVVLLTVA